MDATDKQINYIISLWNRNNNGNANFLDQCRGLGLSQRERRGGMTKARASQIIDELLAEAKESEGN